VYYGADITRIQVSVNFPESAHVATDSKLSNFQWILSHVYQDFRRGVHRKRLEIFVVLPPHDHLLDLLIPISVDLSQFGHEEFQLVRSGTKFLILPHLDATTGRPDHPKRESILFGNLTIRLTCKLLSRSFGHLCAD